MIGSCALTTQTGARAVLDGADCLIAEQVATGYAALFAPGGLLVGGLTALLTVYVAVFGYRLVLGHSQLLVGEVVPHFAKIGLVVALVSAWPSYQLLVVDLLFKGPEYIANAIIGRAGGGSDVIGALQAVFDRLADAAGQAWEQIASPATEAALSAQPGTGQAVLSQPHPALPFGLGAPQFNAALLWFSGLLMLAASVGVLLVARIVLALLLLLGPVFIAAALFAPARGLCEGWLRVTIRFALVPLFTLPFVAVLVAMLVPLVASLDSAAFDTLRDSPALVILLVVTVFVAVMMQAARLGGAIAGGIRLPRRAPQSTTEAAPARESAFETSRDPAASRAQTLVAAIAAQHRRGYPLQMVTPDDASPATRRMTAGPGAASPRIDIGVRLGQGYRRVAVISTVRR